MQSFVAFEGRYWQKYVTLRIDRTEGTAAVVVVAVVVEVAGHIEVVRWGIPAGAVEAAVRTVVAGNPAEAVVRTGVEVPAGDCRCSEESPVGVVAVRRAVEEDSPAAVVVVVEADILAVAVVGSPAVAVGAGILVAEEGSLAEPEVFASGRGWDPVDTVVVEVAFLVVGPCLAAVEDIPVAEDSPVVGACLAGVAVEEASAHRAAGSSKGFEAVEEGIPVAVAWASVVVAEEACPFVTDPSVVVAWASAAVEAGHTRLSSKDFASGPALASVEAVLA